MSPNQVEAAVTRCSELVPTEDDGWDEETQPYAEDAAASVAYALRARLTGDPQEAAWASRRVYEAIDYYVTAQPGLSMSDPGAEVATVSHPLVQAELRRQQQDLRELAELDNTGTIDVRLSHLFERSLREASGFFTSPT